MNWLLLAISSLSFSMVNLMIHARSLFLLADNPLDRTINAFPTIIGCFHSVKAVWTVRGGKEVKIIHT